MAAAVEDAWSNPNVEYDWGAAPDKSWDEAPVAPPKPEKKVPKVPLEEAQKRVEKALTVVLDNKKRMAKHREKQDALSGQTKTLLDEKQVVQSEIDELNSQIDVLREQVNEIQPRKANSKEERDAMNAAKNKLPCNTKGELLDRIDALEYEMEKGIIGVTEQKAILRQIKTLKAALPDVEAFEEKYGTFREEQKNKKELDRITQPIWDQINVLKTQRSTRMDTRTKLNDRLTALREEKTKVGTIVSDMKKAENSEVSGVRELYTEHKKLCADFFAKLKASHEEENAKLREKAALEEKKAKAEQEKKAAVVKKQEALKATQKYEAATITSVTQVITTTTSTKKVKVPTPAAVSEEEDEWAKAERLQAEEQERKAAAAAAKKVKAAKPAPTPTPDEAVVAKSKTEANRAKKAAKKARAAAKKEAEAKAAEEEAAKKAEEEAELAEQQAMLAKQEKRARQKKAKKAAKAEKAKAVSAKPKAKKSAKSVETTKVTTKASSGLPLPVLMSAVAFVGLVVAFLYQSRIAEE